MLIPENWITPPDLKTATIAQREMAQACLEEDLPKGGIGVAGADTSMKWRDSRGPIHAAIAPVGRSPVCITQIPPFPYVSGYLGFREVPALLAAWKEMAEKPALILVDGQGRAHPRRCGIATHLGVVLDMPTIGVGKTLLCGAPEANLGPDIGDHAHLIDRGEVVGMAVRTSPRGRPIFVSVGHRVSLESAVATVLTLANGRRLPLPIRLAHDAANAARRLWGEHLPQS